MVGGGGSITHRRPTEGQRWALTEERLWRTGLGLDCWGLVVEGFLNLEGTVLVFPPLWLCHLSRGGRESGGGRVYLVGFDGGTPLAYGIGA